MYAVVDNVLGAQHACSPSTVDVPEIANAIYRSHRTSHPWRRP